MTQYFHIQDKGPPVLALQMPFSKLCSPKCDQPGAPVLESSVQPRDQVFIVWSIILKQFFSGPLLDVTGR